jgi:zinc D-Ala-D-Ala carboxypeptidase
MAKLPLALASLLLVLGGASCATVATSSPAGPSADTSPSPSEEATPDLVPPAITMQDPAPGAVLTPAGVTVGFSEPVRSVDGGSFQLADASGAVLRSTVILDPAGRFATLVPETLSFATEYTVTLSGLVHDRAGNPLPRTTWTTRTTDVVSFAAGTYTGYQFGDSTARLTAIKRATVDAPSSATASEYRIMDAAGYLLVNSGTLEGYWIHGSSEGVAQDDLAAPIPPLPTCDYLDLPAARVGLSQWATTVLDTVFQLPTGYAPDDLVDTSQAGLNSGYYVRAVATQDLAAMISAAASAGAHLAVQSAYRSYTGQVLTFDGWVSQVGYKEALKTSARPGHSEHQLGTAIDFKTVGAVAPWRYADWATSTEGAWLASNAWKFGWLMSYPKGSSAASCYRYEPWHYRYVGRPTAAAVHAAGVTLRQWLWSQGYGIR